MMRTTTPILSIFIAVLLFMFFTHPEYLKTSDIKAEIDQYRTARDTYEQFSGELQAKLAMKGALSAYESESLERIVPDVIDETQHLVDLEALAKRHSMLFGNTSIEGQNFVIGKKGEKKTAVEGALTNLDISFELVGTYTQLRSFLADLERSLTIFEVTRLSFTVVDGPFQQFALTVRAYALPMSNE